MMRVGGLFRAALAAAIMSLAACSSQSPVLYAIAPIDGREHAGTPAVILLEPVGLERYLERSQIVRSADNYRLDAMANDWWGEPLAAMLGRVLVTELGQRMPRSTVISESGAISTSPDATISLNVRRLDLDQSGQLVLLAQASVILKGQPKHGLRNFRIYAVPPSQGTPGEVAAISRAVAQLADELTDMILATAR